MGSIVFSPNPRDIYIYNFYLLYLIAISQFLLTSPGIIQDLFIGSCSPSLLIYSSMEVDSPLEWGFLWQDGTPSDTHQKWLSHSVTSSRWSPDSALVFISRVKLPSVRVSSEYDLIKGLPTPQESDLSSLLIVVQLQGVGDPGEGVLELFNNNATYMTDGEQMQTKEAILCLSLAITYFTGI